MEGSPEGELVMKKLNDPSAWEYCAIGHKIGTRLRVLVDENFQIVRSPNQQPYRRLSAVILNVIPPGTELDGENRPET